MNKRTSGRTLFGDLDVSLPSTKDGWIRHSDIPAEARKTLFVEFFGQCPVFPDGELGVYVWDLRYLLDRKYE